MIAILYWASPNARGRGFRWITPNSFLALVIWIGISALQGEHVSDLPHIVLAGWRRWPDGPGSRRRSTAGRPAFVLALLLALAVNRKLRGG
jgi:hypothetical protein